jgi:alkanesulfonate monooxygenase SsuD/methylene tetrahydromethanopterin reductase-like flavin-dependent oxidoreductase (luciferase family)
MAAESIDFILRAWSEPEPFDFDGRFWKVKGARIVPKPYTKPRMEVGIACSRTDSTMETAARKGFLPLLTWTTPAAPLASMIETYLRTPGEERAPSRQNVRVGRFVYIADTVAQAKRELANIDLAPINRGRLDGYIPKGGTRDDIDLDYLVDSGAFVCGDVDRVTKILAQFHHDMGGFGTLLLVVGKDWGTKEGRERTARQFMAEVAPKLSAL